MIVNFAMCANRSHISKSKATPMQGCISQMEEKGERELCVVTFLKGKKGEGDVVDD